MFPNRLLKTNIGVINESLWRRVALVYGPDYFKLHNHMQFMACVPFVSCQMVKLFVLFITIMLMRAL